MKSLERDTTPILQNVAKLWNVIDLAEENLYSFAHTDVSFVLSKINSLID